MELTINANRKEVFFSKPAILKEAVKQIDLLTCTEYFYAPMRTKEKITQLNWLYLLDKLQHLNMLAEHPLFARLEEWGVPVRNLQQIEPVIKAKFKQYQKENMKLEEFKQTPAFEEAKKKVLSAFGRPFVDGSTLFEYQIECAAYIVGRRRLLNALDVGLGKSKTTIAGLAADPRNTKILIVAMSRHLSDWQRELKIMGLEDDYIILDTPADMRSSKRFHLVSYEKWSKDNVKFNLQDDEVAPVHCPKCSQKMPVKSHFCKCGFTYVSMRKKPLYKYFNNSYKAAAIDEGHFIKSSDTSRNRSIMAIKTKTRVVLTGTPVENGAADLFWPLVWLMGDSFVFNVYSDRMIANKDSEKKFKNFYGGVRKQNLLDANSISTSTSNEKRLWELLDKIMFRKRKTDADVATEVYVPKPVHRRLHLEMNDAEKSLYNKRLEEFREWYELEQSKKKSAQVKGDTYTISTIEVCSWLDKLRKVASCPWIQDDYDFSAAGQPSKLTFIREKVRENAANKQKMLIFTAHKKTAEQLGTILDEFVPGYKAAYIHGDVPIDYRTTLMTKFQDKNDDLSILVMTTRTGGESYTLTQAKEVILNDLEFNPKKLEQCYGRAVRISQKDEVKITWLISVDTIDANMHSLVLSKKSGADLAVDREALDFTEVAKEFDGKLLSESINYEMFASEMLNRGTKRKDYAV